MYLSETVVWGSQGVRGLGSSSVEVGPHEDPLDRSTTSLRPWFETYTSMGHVTMLSKRPHPPKRRGTFTTPRQTGLSGSVPRGTVHDSSVLVLFRFGRYHACNHCVLSLSSFQRSCYFSHFSSATDTSSTLSSYSGH